MHVSSLLISPFPCVFFLLLLVALATGAACILGVSAIVMGVLVLAVGTSVPDMIGSMIAAKNGEASVRKNHLVYAAAHPSPEQKMPQ